MTYSTLLTAAQVQIARLQAQSVASSATSVIGSNAEKGVRSFVIIFS